MAESTIGPSSVSIGLRPISIGNSLPSLFSPYRSRPAPIGRETGPEKNEDRKSRMVGAEARRHEQLDRLPQHVFALIAEQTFGLGVDHLDPALLLIITIAFGADSTTCRKRSSSFLREEMSTMAESTIGPSSVSIGLSPISIGNSLPSLFRPYRSRPAPMGRDTGSEKNEERKSGMVVPEAWRHQNLDRLLQHVFALDSRTVVRPAR